MGRQGQYNTWKVLFIPFLCSLFLSACLDTNPNLNQAGKDLLKANEIFVEDLDLAFRDTVYVPIYSDIYSQTKDKKFNLTATLSIRNTSLTDSIFVEDIDYYNSQGEKIRTYLSQTLLLVPMQSIEYVVEEDDIEGGTGANFLVNWGSQKDYVQPIFQGVMISTHGQQGISFLTNGVSISRKPETGQAIQDTPQP